MCVVKPDEFWDKKVTHFCFWKEKDRLGFEVSAVLVFSLSLFSLPPFSFFHALAFYPFSLGPSFMFAPPPKCSLSFILSCSLSSLSPFYAFVLYPFFLYPFTFALFFYVSVFFFFFFSCLWTSFLLFSLLCSTPISSDGVSSVCLRVFL